MIQITLVLQFEKAAGEVLAGLQMREVREAGEMVEPTPRDVQILVTSREDPVSMRLLGVGLYLVSDFNLLCYVVSGDLLLVSDRPNTSQSW